MDEYDGLYVAVGWGTCGVSGILLELGRKAIVLRALIRAIGSDSSDQPFGALLIQPLSSTICMLNLSHPIPPIVTVCWDAYQ